MICFSPSTSPMQSWTSTMQGSTSPMQDCSSPMQNCTRSMQNCTSPMQNRYELTLFTKEQSGLIILVLLCCVGYADKLSQINTKRNHYYFLEKIFVTVDKIPPEKAALWWIINNIISFSQPQPQAVVQPQQQPHHLAAVEPQRLLAAEQQQPQHHLDAVVPLLNQHQVIYDILLSVIRPHYHLINIELFLC